MSGLPGQIVCENDQNGARVNTDFSIDHILNRAGDNITVCCENYRKLTSDSSCAEEYSLSQFSWLQCTRYCPPKIPRNTKKEGHHKRQLGRHPRIPFTSQQSSILEERFRQSPYLSSEEVTKLSAQLQLPGVRVKIWFQNRRARERREKNTIEDMQNSHLKSTSPEPSTSAQTVLSHNLENSISKSTSPPSFPLFNNNFPTASNYHFPSTLSLPPNTHNFSNS